MPKIDACLASCVALSTSSVKPTADQQKDVAAMYFVLSNWKTMSSILGKTVTMTWEEMAAAYEKAR